MPGHRRLFRVSTASGSSGNLQYAIESNGDSPVVLSLRITSSECRPVTGDVPIEFTVNSGSGETKYMFMVKVPRACWAVASFSDYEKERREP